MSCKGRGGTWCMVPNCTSNTKEKLSVFFGLPKEPERRKLWLKEVGRMDLDVACGKHFRVCHLHFEDVMYANDIKNRLNAKAVPTLRLPENPEANQPTDVTISKLQESPKVSKSKINIISVKVFPSGDCQPSTSSNIQEPILPNFSDCQPSTSSFVWDPNLPTSSSLTSSAATQTSTLLSANSPRKNKMRSKIKTLRKQLSKTSPNVDKEEDKVLELEQLRTLCYKYFSKPLADVLNGQISL
ncbi:hypothetical protein FQR65_LT08965 [Abscondita terminalis]|nr:hypothetical protein FQR65_LT08965 [Abscondita terminalis]